MRFNALDVKGGELAQSAREDGPKLLSIVWCPAITSVSKSLLTSRKISRRPFRVRDTGLRAHNAAAFDIIAAATASPFSVVLRWRVNWATNLSIAFFRASKDS